MQLVSFDYLFRSQIWNVKTGNLTFYTITNQVFNIQPQLQRVIYYVIT